jgi:hypothetical protein
LALKGAGEELTAASVAVVIGPSGRPDLGSDGWAGHSDVGAGCVLVGNVLERALSAGLLRQILFDPVHQEVVQLVRSHVLRDFYLCSEIRIS